MRSFICEVRSYYQRAASANRLGAPPNKGQPPNKGHRLVYQGVPYSEVPLYTYRLTHGYGEYT